MPKSQSLKPPPFQQDINNKTGKYEAAFTYYISSDNDYVIGKTCCNHNCTELKDATGFSRQIMPHASLIASTKDIQLQMIQNHTNPLIGNTTVYNTLFGFY